MYKNYSALCECFEISVRYRVPKNGTDKSVGDKSVFALKSGNGVLCLYAEITRYFRGGNAFIKLRDPDEVFLQKTNIRSLKAFSQESAGKSAASPLWNVGGAAAIISL